MYTEINPPSFYEKDEDIKYQCEICKEYTTKELTLVRIPFRNITQKVYMCDECLSDRDEK